MDAEGTALVKLSLSLYDDEQSPKRNQVTVVGVRVSRFETTLDVAELKDNVRAGNIADGRIENGMLSLELTGGRVEIEAKEFRADAV